MLKHSPIQAMWQYSRP